MQVAFTLFCNSAIIIYYKTTIYINFVLYYLSHNMVCLTVLLLLLNKLSFIDSLIDSLIDSFVRSLIN